MVGVVRLYVEPNPRLPEHMRPDECQPVIDCCPTQARQVRRDLLRKGYSVVSVPI